MNQFEDEILIKDATGRFKVLRGGRLYDLEEISLPKPVLAAAQVVEKIIKESGITVEERLKKRLEEIIDAYLRDVRDRFETKSTLTQQVNAGGMAFSAEQANLIIQLIDKAKTRPPKAAPEKEKILPVPPKASPAAPPVAPSAKETEAPPVLEKVAAPLEAPPSPPLSAPPITSGVAEFVFSPADEQEILAHKEKLPVLVAGLKPIEIAKLIDEIIRESGLVLDEINRKKLENILLTHLKDIRDGYETRATLLYAPEPAGLGLKEEQIEKVLSAARKKVSVLEERLRKEEEEKIRKAIEEEKQKIALERKKAEEKIKEKIDARWTQITGKPAETASLTLGSELLAPPIAMQPKAAAPQAPVSPGITKIVEAPPLPKVQPPEKPTVPVKEIQKPVFPPEPEVPKKEITPPVLPSAPPKVKPLEILKPVQPAYRRPEVPSKRPRLEDIKVKPRLIGPVEEIREMTLIDFRRLSNEPREAVQKIKEKLNLLEKESLTKKIAGIRAWQESEVNKLYLGIAKEIITQGKPVSEIIKKREEAGKPVLTEEEIKAIMELNKSLRY